MNNYNEIKRKNYRFPAYDDKEGVKIQREGKRNLFANDRSWLTPNKTADYQSATSRQSVDKTQPAGAKIQPVAKSESAERTLRRSRKETLDKQGLTIRQQTELKKHRDNLPDYNKKITAETDAVGRTSLFGKEPRKSSLRNPSATPKEESSIKREYSGRSYFVPKYIPASVLPDESSEQEAKIGKDELLNSLKKPKESYLMFDQEPAAYQEKRGEEPSVKKFPATEITEEPVKRKGILERGLKGLIQDEALSAQNKGYFNKKG